MIDWPWRNSPYIYSIWCFLLEEASGTERDALFKGKRITLQPGQLVTGRRKISLFTGISESYVQKVLKRLEKEGQLEQRTSSTSRLITIVNWDRYSNQEQPSADLVGTAKDTTKEQQSNIKVTQSEKYKKSKNLKRKFVLPTLEEVTAYCIERKNNVDPGRFIDHYTSNGWKVGKNSMKDWRASVRQWERGNAEQQKKEPQAGYHSEAPRLEGERSDMPDGFMDTVSKIGR